MSMEEIIDFRILEPSDIVDDLLTYLEMQIPAFPLSSEFVKILEVKKNENQHSLSFCVFMTNKCQSKYYFARENSQSASSVIDIGVYKGEVLIFTIEAKLLPTPNVKIGGRSEHEYVHGDGAGIQRFKEGKHGLDNSNVLLPKSGLIGFIKEQDFDYWLNKVNQWILDAKWDKSEQLKKIHFSTFGKLESTHSRSKTDSINLHHFWIKVV